MISGNRKVNAASSTAAVLWVSNMGSIAFIEPSGRLSLPSELRDRHGLHEGSRVIIEEAGDALLIRQLPTAVEEVQKMARKMLAGRPGASVDDFLADRREEAKRE
jgi:AbrB family looped-hinge helix DNA binding protein